jgi:hypothetical protein
MTKKDYIAIAGAINQSNYVPKADTGYAEGTANACYTIAHKLAYIMERDNPRFDRARFLAACGVQS